MDQNSCRDRLQKEPSSFCHTRERKNVILQAGYPFLILLIISLTPLTFAQDELHIKVKAFNAAMVKLSCQYDGSEGKIMFDVLRDGRKCIHYPLGTCQTPEPDCQFQCLDLGHRNIVSFLVNLNGSCHERIAVTCMVRSYNIDNALRLDSSYLLTAQSDVPEISVNNDEPITASARSVPIMCTIKNRCNLTKLEILGDIHMKPVINFDREEGGRFSTTAQTTALFNKAGNYTITCKEKGKEGIFSKNVTVIVEPEEESFQMAPWIITAAIVTVLILCYHIIRRIGKHFCGQKTGNGGVLVTISTCIRKTCCKKTKVFEPEELGLLDSRENPTPNATLLEPASPQNNGANPTSNATVVVPASPQNNGVNTTPNATLVVPASPQNNGVNTTPNATVVVPASPQNNGANPTPNATLVEPASPQNNGVNTTPNVTVVVPASPQNNGVNTTPNATVAVPASPQNNGVNTTPNATVVEPASPLNNGDDKIRQSTINRQRRSEWLKSDSHKDSGINGQELTRAEPQTS